MRFAGARARLNRLGLGKIAGDSWQRVPLQAAGDVHDYNLEPSVPASVFGSSAIADVVRQGLTKADLPGRYKKEAMEHFDQRRSEHPDIRDRTSRIGEIPDNLNLQPVGPLGEKARVAAQVAGQVGRDVTTQGALMTYWLLNAPEAVAMVATQAAVHGSQRSAPRRSFGGMQLGGREATSPAAEARGDLPSGSFRLPGTATMAVFPSILGAGLATGTLARDEGYQAVLPTAEDFTESENPLAEQFLRLTGRKGRLLPYSQLVDERPDVSSEAYKEYQRYRNGSRGIVKATDNQMHGPEVALFGRSVPLLTGIIPLAATMLGARRGARMAGNRLAGRGVRGLRQPGSMGPDRLDLLSQQKGRVKGIERSEGWDSEPAKRARRDYEKAERDVQFNLVGGTAAGGAAGLLAGGLVGSVAESIRRSRQMELNKQEALQEQANEALNNQESLQESEEEMDARLQSEADELLSNMRRR